MFCALIVVMIPLIHASLKAGQQIGYEKELAEIEELSADLIDYIASSSWFYIEKTGRALQGTRRQGLASMLETALR